MTEDFGPDATSAVVLDAEPPRDKQVLDSLRCDPTVPILDTTAAQTASLAAQLPPAGPELIDEPPQWAYYPWRRTLVGILGRQAFARVRCDRNRHLITSTEQRRLAALKVG